MKQASERIDQSDMAAGSGPEVANGLLDLGMASARIEAGLLMVFGPEGDPLPPRVFQEAAAIQSEAWLMFEGQHRVAATRVAEVLEAQSRQRLDPADGAWLRAMLGVGPQPEPATAEELAAEGSIELTLFGRELLIGVAGGGSLLLRCRRADDDEPGLAAHEDGGALDHDAVLAALFPGSAGETGPAGPWCRFEVEPPDVVVTTGEGRCIRLSEAAPGSGVSVLSTPGGETVAMAALAQALGAGAPTVEPGGSATGDDDHGGNRAMTTAPTLGLPVRLDLDRDGLLDLGWLAGAGEQLAGGSFESLLLSGLPASVRPSLGSIEGSAWRVAADEIHDLKLVATPEGLAAFTLGLRFEGDGDPVDWSLPVTVPEDEVDEAGGSASQPLSVRLDFPPPFSVRNRLEYFAVIMVDGLPKGATLSAGVPGGHGRWILAPEDLRDLRAHLPVGAALPCRLTATGVTIENRDGLLSTASRSVTIDPGAFHPRPDGAPPAVAALDLGPLLGAVGEGQRIDAVALNGLPPVVDLSRGTFDPVSGCWVLRRDELGEIAMIVRDPALRHLTLKAKAVAIDQRGQASAISRTLEVDVPAAAVADLEPVESGPGFFRTLAARRA